MLKCPRCGRQNAEDALFCARCGLRLGGTASGVTYRQRREARGFGYGQGILALLIIILAGIVIAGGAFAILMAGRPGFFGPGIPPTATPLLTPSPSASPSASPSPSFTPSPLITPSPTPIVIVPTPSPTGSLLPSATPTTTPTLPPPTAPPPTATPRPTPRPTPQPTPVNCEASSNPNDEPAVIGFGNRESRNVRNTWCVHSVRFHQVNGHGVTRLMRNDRVIREYSCLPGSPCEDQTFTFDPPRRVVAGSVLRYVFECIDDPFTLEDDCAPGSQSGATISIEYEVFGP